jgi:hypothetical protein
MGGGVRALMRRKQVDSERARAAGAHQLRKELSVIQLIAIGPDLSFFFSCSLSFLSWALVLVDLSGTLVFVKVRAPMRVLCLDLVFYRSKRQALR